jgi:hypothetical protein
LKGRDSILQNIPITFLHQPIHPDIDADVEESISLMEKASFEAPKYQGPFVQLPLTPPEDYEFCLERIVFSNDQLQPILNACKKNKVTFHSILVTSFALAIYELSLSKSKQILMRSSIDLRRRVSTHISKEIICTAVTGHITCINDLTMGIVDIGKYVMQEIRTSTENGTVFEDYKNYAHQLSSSIETPIALNISDMGLIELSNPIHLKHKSFEYATGLKKKYPNVSIAINPVGLLGSIVYVKGAIAEDTVGQLSKLTMEFIKKIIAP